MRICFTKSGMDQLMENNILKAVNNISESLRLYTLILNPKNSYITKCEDSLAKCFATAGKTLVIKLTIFVNKRCESMKINIIIIFF